MKKLALAALLSLTVIFMVAGCNSQPNGDESDDMIAAANSRPVIGMPNDLPSPLPFASPGAQTQIVANATFSKLIYIDTDNDFEALPGLAHSWESNETASVWTFFLRDDVVFHSGHPFTANDVAFTFERASSTENEGIAFLLPGADYIEEVVVVDAHTVTFRLNRSTADWPFYAAVNIMSKEAVEELGIEYGMRIGSGPFYFVNEEWDPGVSWVIRRFDEYWGEPAPSEEIEFRLIADLPQLTLALETGEVDAIFQPDPADLAKLLNSAEFNVFQSENVANIFLGVNTEHEAGENPDIRRAIAHAVDRDAIVAAAYQDGKTGVPSYNFINNASPGYLSVDHIPFDIDASRNILGELGFSEDNRLAIDLYTYDIFMPAAVELQTSLNQSYFSVGVIEMSRTGFTAALSERRTWDIYLEETFSAGGVLNIVQNFLAHGASYNLSRYNSDALQALLASAADAASMDELMNRFALIQEYLAEHVPVIPLVQQYVWVVGRDNFFGVQLGSQSNAVCFAGAYVTE